VSSTVDIALISGGWTALVGLAGFGAAIYNNNRTIGNARKEKIRDWRADTYIDLIRAISYRHNLRRYESRALSPDDRFNSPAGAQFVAGLTLPDPQDIQARQMAYGSQAVWDATSLSSRLHEKFVMAFRDWQANPTEQNQAVALAARVAAETADDETVELVRKDLHGKGKPLTDWEKISLEK
jgi:hypothetical protein